MSCAVTGWIGMMTISLRVKKGMGGFRGFVLEMANWTTRESLAVVVREVKNIKM